MRNHYDMESFRYESPIPRTRHQGGGIEVKVDERAEYKQPNQRMQQMGESRRERSLNSRESKNG